MTAPNGQAFRPLSFVERAMLRDAINGAQYVGRPQGDPYFDDDLAALVDGLGYERELEDGLDAPPRPTRRYVAGLEDAPLYPAVSREPIDDGTYEPLQLAPRPTKPAPVTKRKRRATPARDRGGATSTPAAQRRKQHPRPEFGVGVCRLCHDEYALRSDGLVRRHGVCAAAPPLGADVVEVPPPAPAAPLHPRAGEYVLCRGCGFRFPLDHDGYLPLHPHASGVPYVKQAETRPPPELPGERLRVTAESPDYAQLVRRARG